VQLGEGSTLQQGAGVHPAKPVICYLWFCPSVTSKLPETRFSLETCPARAVQGEARTAGSQEGGAHAEVQSHGL
jgi:hypothetical protein